MKLPSFFKRFSSIRHSLFCCRGFQAFWENREKSGMSIEVHQRDGKPEFWLQMRVVDQAQEDLFRRIEKAKRLDLELLPETDQNRSCEVILWTESRIFHCPWCGKMKELNATSINFFKNQIVLSGKFKENLNFTLTLNDDESLFEIFENNFLIETHLIDKDNYSPTLQHDLTDGTATIIFADYSFTFPEALLYPNRVEKRKQILSYIYKFNKKIEFINNNAQKDSNAKYKSFQELPEILKAVICSELNSGEMIPNEIFVNTKYDELKNQTILEAMNTLIESHSEEKATSIIRQKILENPFAY